MAAVGRVAAMHETRSEERREARVVIYELSCESLSMTGELLRVIRKSKRDCDRSRDFSAGVLLRRCGIVFSVAWNGKGGEIPRSEEHTSELQSLMRITYAV